MPIKHLMVLLCLEVDHVWAHAVRLLDLAMKISVQSIIQRHRLKFSLKIFGMFLYMAPLLVHLMSGLRTMDIAGIQLRQIFDMVLFLHLKSIG